MSSLHDAQQLFDSEVSALRNIAASHFATLDPDAKEEAIQNVLYLTWRGFAPLADRDMADHEHLRACLSFAIRQHRAGRRARLNSDVSKDLLDHARRSGGIIVVQHIDMNFYVDPHRQSIPDMVAFRIDVPEWLEWLGPEWSARAIDLTEMSTGQAAVKHGVTPGAVSQWRTRLNEMWRRFHGE